MKAKQPQANIICTGCVCRWGRPGTHFPRGLDSLPDAEEADDPHCQETQGQVPLQGPDVLDPGGDAQHVASVGWGGHMRLERHTRTVRSREEGWKYGREGGVWGEVAVELETGLRKSD